jgi:hypothetical protein
VIHVDGHDRLHQYENQPGALAPLQYRLEASLDGKTYFPVFDKGDNKRAAVNLFDEFKPVRCRLVRLTVTGFPPGVPLALLEFTVFGKSAESRVIRRLTVNDRERHTPLFVIRTYDQPGGAETTLLLPVSLALPSAELMSTERAFLYDCVSCGLGTAL